MSPIPGADWSYHSPVVSIPPGALPPPSAAAEVPTASFLSSLPHPSASDSHGCHFFFDLWPTPAKANNLFSSSVPLHIVSSTAQASPRSGPSF
jgi:hypothetical protein